MAGRSKGWTDLVDPEELEDNEKTEEVPVPAFEDNAEAVDPVLAALAELDGPQAAKVAAKKIASHAAPNAPTAKPAGHHLGKQRTHKPKQKLVLPRPDDAPLTASTPPRPAGPLPSPAERPSPSGGERPSITADLVRQLELDGRRSSEQGPGFWAEYRQVIITCVVGVALVVLGFVYQRHTQKRPVGKPFAAAAEKAPPADLGKAKRPEPPAPPANDRSMAPAPSSPPSAGAEEGLRPGPAVAPAPEAPTEVQVPPTTSMLSVVTVPPGATVEINGEVVGKTPLIAPGPKNIKSMNVTLSLGNFRTWNQVVSANALGHFSINVELERAGP